MKAGSKDAGRLTRLTSAAQKRKGPPVIKTLKKTAHLTEAEADLIIGVKNPLYWYRKMKGYLTRAVTPEGDVIIIPVPVSDGGLLSANLVRDYGYKKKYTDSRIYRWGKLRDLLRSTAGYVSYADALLCLTDCGDTPTRSASYAVQVLKTYAKKGLIKIVNRGGMDWVALPGALCVPELGHKPKVQTAPEQLNLFTPEQLKKKEAKPERDPDLTKVLKDIRDFCGQMRDTLASLEKMQKSDLKFKEEIRKFI